MDFLQIMGNHSSIGKKEKRTEINERSVRVNLNMKKRGIHENDNRNETWIRKKKIG